MKETHENLCACMLGDNSVFNFLDAENLGDLCPFFQCMTISAGATLWKEGDSCDYLAFITSGRIEVKKQTDFEGKHVVVGVYNQGAIIGALCVIDDSPRAVTAIALEDTSLAVLSRENFEKLVNEQPEMGAKLMKGMLLSLSIRLRKSFERLSKFF